MLYISLGLRTNIAFNSHNSNCIAQYEDIKHLTDPETNLTEMVKIKHKESFCICTQQYKYKH